MTNEEFYKKLPALINGAVQGNNDAVREIMGFYRPMMLSYARTYVHSDTDAADIVQVASVKAFHGIDNLEEASQFGGYLRTLVHNEAVNFVISSYQKKFVSWNNGSVTNETIYNPSDETISFQPQMAYDEKSLHEIVLKILDSLPEDQRTITLLHFYENMNFKTISDNLSVPVTAVMDKLQNAKNSIQISVTNLQNTEGVNLYNLTPLAFFLSLLNKDKTYFTTGIFAYQIPVKPPVQPQVQPQPHYDTKTGMPAGQVVKKAKHGLSLGLKIAIGAAVGIACGIGSGVIVARRRAQESAQKTDTGTDKKTVTVSSALRPALLSADTFANDPEITVSDSLNDYTLESDFSNVINPELVTGLSDDAKNKLLQNYFVATDSYSDEFFETYEANTYGYTPSFITVDSILHTFHLYYAYLQRNLESTTLSDNLNDMSVRMADTSRKQLEELKGTSYEKAAQRNVDYFDVASSLLGTETADLSDTAKAELKLINDASEMTQSPLFGYDQDYTQFKPRGYYTKSDTLQKYFRAMMWFGQMSFLAKDEDMDRSAILLVKGLNGDALTDWENVYQTTAFFAGESDDNGYYEYEPYVSQYFGENDDVKNLPDEEDAFDDFVSDVKSLKAPRVNSMIVIDPKGDMDVAEETKSFRVMGQRFSIDAGIMQKLVFNEVKKNDKGEKRMLPDPLDVPAAFGNDTALQIAEDNGASAWPDYKTNMDEIRDNIQNSDSTEWSASIASSWLYTMKPILNEKDSNYPKFMTNDAWAKKDVSSFLGGYTELKHDTVLYAKQVMAELGGEGGDKPDDRGYVEPQPVVYARLASLARNTVSGLQNRNLISDEDAQYMNDFADIVDKLETIANKELNNELPTDDEFDFIRAYGGNLEHLWERTIDVDGNTSLLPYDHPSALVTDIATDPNGQFLEIADGRPLDIYVAVYFDGEVRIAKGSIWSFYTWNGDERMTDEEWQKEVQSFDGTVRDQPAWIDSFKGDTNW